MSQFGTERLNPDTNSQPFDNEAYLAFVTDCETAVKDARWLTMRQADHYKKLLLDNQSLVRQSLTTPHYPTTLNLAMQMHQLPASVSNRDFIEAIPDFLDETLADLPELTQTQPDTYLTSAYKLADSLSRTPNPRFTNLGARIFTGALDQFLATSEISDLEASHVVRRVIDTADDELLKKLTKDALTPDSPLTRRFPRPIDSILNLGLLGYNVYERPRRLTLILDEVSGGYSKSLLDAWDDSEGKTKDREKGTEAVHINNFGLLCQLENTRSGITRFMIENYRMLTFDRYPVELILQQFDAQDQIGPYGLFVAGRHDYNGFVARMKDVTANAWHQSEEIGLGFKVIEAETSDEMFDGIIQTADRHGPISYVIVVAHGDPNFIRLGYQTQNGQDGLDKSSLALQVPPELRSGKILLPKAPIALVSCSTGVAEGIGQELSTILPENDIHSPDADTSLKENGIKIARLPDGTLDLRVLFTIDDGNYNTTEDVFHASKSYFRGLLNIRSNVPYMVEIPTRVYRNGALHRDYTS